MALTDIQKPRRILTLYHGSPILDINRFDISKSRQSFLDYGKGIYFTTNESQAMLWSIKKSNIGAVYTIKLDNSVLKLKQYLTKSNEFINTFCMCRAGYEDKVNEIAEYNAIYGYVVDSDREKIFKYTNDYVIGKASFYEVRANIKVFDDKDQLCIKSQHILDMINIDSVRYTEYTNGFPRNDWRAVKWKI